MGPSAASLLTYVGLYSLGLAAVVGVLTSTKSTSVAKCAVPASTLLIMAVGFPPSPLFTLKLYLSGFVANVGGWVPVLALIGVMLCAWYVLGCVLRALLAAATSGRVGASRRRFCHQSYRSHTGLALLVLLSFFVLLCSPLGVAVAASLL